MYSKIEPLELKPEVIEAIKKFSDVAARAHFDEFDKTLDAFIDKIGNEGWTIPSQINIYAVNVIGRTEDIDDITELFGEFYMDNDFDKLKKLIQNVNNSAIKPGLKKLTNECWDAFQSQLYAVCANSLVSVIEGILSEYSDDKDDINRHWLLYGR